MMEPIKSRASSELIAAWQKCYNVLRQCGIQPKLHIMDNKISEDMKQVINKENVTI